MVHIKRVELSHFKSFGGTTQVPLLPGFTVVSGPNGSGKSNILDALLFCLGLSTSKGMRAERLPDLVNHNHGTNNNAEAIVSVTFDISDLDNNILLSPANADEWTVTRRLRVTKGGNYSSIYYVNGQICSATELYEQLNRLRVYPEGYNVVLQGDVTRIITMNSKERREIIDELAGVAEFDRKIEQTKKTLEDVREREERCRIIEQELQKNLERLASDRIRAEKYQQLRAKIHEKQQWEVVLIWRSLLQQQEQLLAQISANKTEEIQLKNQLEILNAQVEQATNELEQLNNHVKQLGEEEHLDLTSQLATQKAKRHQLQQQEEELENRAGQTQKLIENYHSSLTEYQQNLSQINQDKHQLENQVIPFLFQQVQNSIKILEASKEKAATIATSNQTTLQEQTALSRQISQLQNLLNPQRSEQAQLTERYHQLQQRITEQNQLITTLEQEIENQQIESNHLSVQLNTSQQKIQSLAQQLAATEAEKSLQQETQTRLLKEQRENQRQLDKLEATKQAQQEAQGTYATKIILQSDLPGLCGLVANLGEVEPRYQLALEIAAGARLGYIVVEDDSIAAAGIELLKQKKAGRTTFLPLNKIQTTRINEVSGLKFAKGFINLAINLIECQPKFHSIFSYVFGSTVVFENLDYARYYLGKFRIVTLEGEILETSGAMTGGSKTTNSIFHFGTANSIESEEVENLRKRLKEIDQVLYQIDSVLDKKNTLIKQLTQEINEARQLGREQQLHFEQLGKEGDRLTQQKQQVTQQIAQNHQERETVESRLLVLGEDLPILEQQLQVKQAQLAELEKSHISTEWQEIRQLIEVQEQSLQEHQQSLRQEEERLKDWQNQYLRIGEKQGESEKDLAEAEERLERVVNQRIELKNQLKEIEEKIANKEILLEQLGAKIETAKKARDRTETKLRELQNQRQQKTWQLQKLEEIQQEKRITLGNIEEQIAAQKEELPDPLPEVPLLVTGENMEGDNRITFDNFTTQLEQLQKEIRNSQKRLESMEPVNMLALEEYEQTKARLDELSSKLTTLNAERNELLLRAENFTTLRYRAFKEAFDAVNENFKSIFATLSEGDGYLQVDDSENPFNGGLNLVAHPKGKPVQRLSSMSGGEKSLTALSFIFALQKYRPSPFYAFDEVDMFLDGSNVERLAKMIAKQAEQAQFIVVSLRRPMIEASERTIGVTQARGAYTQVLGIKL